MSPASSIESPLSPIKIDAEFALNNILFESNSYKLLEISQHELGTLIEFLELNPTVEIEIQGHTDNVGSRDSNIALSEARAQAVADYMENTGFDTTRLVVAGYGPDQPKADNATPEGRAVNRRIEFKVEERSE